MSAAASPENSQAQRLRPQSSWLTAPFWAAAREHRLVRPYCQACGISFFTPQLCCPRCLREDWQWQPSTGRGEVYSFSVVHRAPLPGFEPPYVVAIVDLEEGWHMLTNLVACDPRDVRIGLPVQVDWQTVGGDGQDVIPVFRPRAVEGAGAA